MKAPLKESGRSSILYLAAERTQCESEAKIATSQFVHRVYAECDLDDCVAVFRSNVPAYFREHELNDFMDFLENCDTAQRRTDDQRSDRSYLVVLSNGQIVGCGGFGQRAGCETADLCWGMVQQTCHGRRIGEYLLLSRLHQIVTTTDARAIRLGTSQLTEAFFGRYGFSIQSVSKNGIDTGLDDVEMRLELSDESRRLIIERWMRRQESRS